MWPFTSNKKSESWYLDYPKLLMTFGQRDGGRPIYELMEGFIHDKGMVPKGFKTDLASIPGLFEWYAEPDDRNVIPAAICHDYLYQKKKGTRKAADIEFRKNLIKSGMRKSKAWVMYWAVRVGGKKGWDAKPRGESEG